MVSRDPKLERLILTLAARQNGLVARDQLLARGISESHIQRLRLRVGELQVARGVYEVIPRPHDLRFNLRALQISTADRSLIIGAGALFLYSLIRENDAIVTQNPLELGISNRSRTQFLGARVRMLNDVEFASRQQIDEFEVASPERALVDACRLTSPTRAERLIEDALRLKIVTPQTLQQRLEVKTAGNTVLRRILDRYDHIEKSNLEVRLAQLLRRFGIEQPIFQYELRVKHGDRKSMRIDAYWECARLAVELDGFAYHSNARELQSDRIRQNALLGQGIQLRRYSFADIQERPGEVAREIKAALKNRRSVRFPS
jgi:very-short-patch-repair endonuclease